MPCASRTGAPAVYYTYDHRRFWSMVQAGISQLRVRVVAKRKRLIQSQLCCTACHDCDAQVSVMSSDGLRLAPVTEISRWRSVNSQPDINFRPDTWEIHRWR